MKTLRFSHSEGREALGPKMVITVYRLMLSTTNSQAMSFSFTFKILILFGYLNLSQAGFMGLIPLQLENLSKLQYLDLNQVFMERLYVQNLKRLSGFWTFLLEYLDLEPWRSL
ncbi:hypothetical protein WN944_014364 [Citrus x changshan-huyou]|uniref:Uncharacterized protein n=1 Tax=Citrus x changshan-huyou TaxID=2935761 RepID=A0AAP0QKQ0_9ROSI